MNVEVNIVTITRAAYLINMPPITKKRRRYNHEHTNRKHIKFIKIA